VKPRVGVISSPEAEDFLYYVDGKLIYSDKDVPGLDIVIFTGGADVDPSIYEEEKKSWCGWTDISRDFRERAILKLAISSGVKVLGICRGHQLINAILGGKLVQDIQEELGHAHASFTSIEGVSVHDFRPEPNGHWLYPGMAELFPVVNTFHHQAVKVPGKGQEVMCAARDGVIESTVNSTGSIVTFQFHPEWGGIGTKYFQKVMETGNIMFW
jgi:putative glutamine amidotransferase